MHNDRTQSAQTPSSHAEAESAAWVHARQAPAFRLSSFRARAAAAVTAVFVSATTLGAVLALYGTPDSAAIMAHAVPVERLALAAIDRRMESVSAPTSGPRSHIPTRPCLASPRQCA